MQTTLIAPIFVISLGLVLSTPVFSQSRSLTKHAEVDDPFANARVLFVDQLTRGTEGWGLSFGIDTRGHGVLEDLFPFLNQGPNTPLPMCTTFKDPCPERGLLNEIPENFTFKFGPDTPEGIEKWSLELSNILDPEFGKNFQRKAWNLRVTGPKSGNLDISEVFDDLRAARELEAVTTMPLTMKESITREGHEIATWVFKVTERFSREDYKTGPITPPRAGGCWVEVPCQSK